MGIRTPGLVIANDALYQLSYTPEKSLERQELTREEERSNNLVEFTRFCAPHATTAGAATVEGKDAKTMVDSKTTAGAVAGAETMSPVQKLLDGLTVAVGCNNMFDQDPPFILGGNSNTDLSVYDPYGQFVYFEVSKKF